jgi:hypothetical protein
VTLVRVRPRPTRRFLTAISYAATSEIAVTTVRTRPRHTISRLTAVSYPATSQIAVHLVRARPRPTRHFLTQVTYPQVTPISEAEVFVKTVIDDRERRRARSFLQPGIVEPSLRPPDRRLAITTSLARIRPRPTKHLLGPLIFYPQTSAVAVTYIRVRPRRTHVVLGPPTLAAAAVVTTLAVHLTRTRPRPTAHFLLAPVVEPYLRAPDRRLAIPVTLVRTRPRPTTKFAKPGVVEPSLRAPDRRLTVTVTEVRLRPRRPVHFVTPPPPATTAIVTPVPAHLARTRPRTTVRFLRTPISEPPLRAPDRRLRVATTLVRARPRHTIGSLTRVTYAATSVIAVHLVRTRPRPTVHTGLTLTVYRQTSTVRVTVTRIRPRHTAAHLAPPTLVLPLPTLAVQTVKVTLAGRTRSELGRRAPHSTLRAPLITAPPPTHEQQTLRVTLIAIGTRLGLVPRRPHYLLSAPAVIRPLTGFEFRVSAPPSSAWTTYRMSSGWEDDDPESGFTVGKPSADWTTDPPDSDIQAGKPS